MGHRSKYNKVTRLRESIPPYFCSVYSTGQMHEGRIILDIKGEEKKNLTVEMLMEQFARASGGAFANDRALLG